MTKYYNFAFDLQSIRVSVIAIEVMAVWLLYLWKFLGYQLDLSLLKPENFHKCEIAYPRTN